MKIQKYLLTNQKKGSSEFVKIYIVMQEAMRS